MSGTATFVHSRRHDLAFAVPLAVLFAFACAGDVIIIAREAPAAHGLRAMAALATQAATLVFFALQLLLCLTRRLPLRKADGIWPRAVAIAGANFNFVLLLLPRAALGESGTMVSAALTIGGTLASIAALAWLGRSFSIFPEGRGLVTRGPYRLVRHPLYLAEIVSTLGIMLQFRQPWAALVAGVTIAFQILRMRYEEEVLARAFPAYEDYRRRTARLVPGVY